MGGIAPSPKYMTLPAPDAGCTEEATSSPSGGSARVVGQSAIVNEVPFTIGGVAVPGSRGSIWSKRGSVRRGQEFRHPEALVPRLEVPGYREPLYFTQIGEDHAMFRSRC
jgi:hypothetical protein